MAYIVMAYIVIAYLVMDLCTHGQYSYGLYSYGLYRWVRGFLNQQRGGERSCVAVRSCVAMKARMCIPLKRSRLRFGRPTRRYRSQAWTRRTAGALPYSEVIMIATAAAVAAAAAAAAAIIIQA